MVRSSTWALVLQVAQTHTRVVYSTAEFLDHLPTKADERHLSVGRGFHHPVSKRSPQKTSTGTIKPSRLDRPESNSRRWKPVFCNNE
jgi:hypothetical protein